MIQYNKNMHVGGYMGIGMLLVALWLVVHQFEAMIVKHYGQKHGKGGMFF